MTKQNGPRERIVETACRLFYNQGYNNTGINQLLEEAKVAKASLYQHFGSKEEVGLTYLKVARVEWFEGLDKWTGTKTDPKQKLIACFDFLEYALRINEFRGCKFINMLSELADSASPMHDEIIEHKAKLRSYMKNFVREALANRASIVEDVEKYESVGDSIYLMFEGAIVESKIYKDAWPILAAKKTVKTLLENN